MKFVFIILTMLIIQIPSLVRSETGRGLVCDRPGATDNPKTMDDGEYRIETAVFTSENTTDQSIYSRTLTYGSLLLVRGVSDRAEVQVGLDGYKHTDAGGSHDGGLGATKVRLKYNLVGNDEGTIAVAVIPNIVHSGRLGGDQIMGGVNLPFAFTLPQDWSLSVMPAWDHLKGFDGSGSDRYTFAFVLGKSFTDKLSAFIDHAAYFGDQWSSSYIHGVGVAYQMMPGLQLDAGLNYGKDGTAENFIYSVGFVYWL